MSTYLFNSSVTDIQKRLETIQKEYDRVLRLANTNTGKIMPVNSCKNMGQIMFSISSYETTECYVKPTLERVIKKATEHAEILIAMDREIHKENLPALENNKKLREDVTKLMENIGIPARYETSKYTTRGSRKTETHASGWMDDICRCVKIDDGYETSERTYKDTIEKIEKYKLEKEQEQNKVLAEKEQKEKDAIALRKLSFFLVKYHLEPTTDWNTLLEQVISKDKYLQLGHYLCKNRGDGSDGCSYAEFGLRGFNVESKDDRLIYEEIHSMTEDWDGDGRCFRDCKYNYDYLFSLAPKELYEDYQKIKEHILD